MKPNDLQVKWDKDGLAPAIVQDAATKDVLMLAYMNEESLRLSLESGETWFYSRSRQELWHKGATSGNTQRIVDLRYDCDSDTLLVLVHANGPACHTGANTCFYRSASSETVEPTGRYAILDRLQETIAQREQERPEGAYTTYLFEKGVDKILKKVGEEAAEVIIAAKNRDPDELRYESADLLFHLLVLLKEQNLPLDDVLQELARRHK